MANASPAQAVVKGTALVLVQGIVTDLMLLIYFGFAARLLPTVAELGSLAALALVLGLVTAGLTLAVPTVAAKLFAENVGHGRADVSRGIFRKALALGLALAVASGLALFALARPLASLVLGDGSLEQLIWLLGLDSSLIILRLFLATPLYASMRFGVLSAPNIIGSIVRYGVAIILLQSGLGLTGVLVGWIVGDLAPVALFLMMVRQYVRRPAPSYPSAPLLRGGMPLALSHLVVFFSDSVDRLLILALSGTTALGIYSPAVTAAVAAALVSSSLGRVLLPQLSTIRGSSGLQGSVDAARKAVRFTSLVCPPIFFGLVALAQPVIILLAGERYAVSAFPLAILSFSLAFTCMASVPQTMLVVNDMNKSYLLSSLLSVGTSVVLGILLIAPLGAAGAAVSRSGLLLVGLLVPLLLLQRRGQPLLDVQAFGKATLSGMFMAAVLMVVQWVSPASYLWPLLVPAGAMLYAVALRLTRGVSSADFKLLQEVVPPRLHGLVAILRKIILPTEARRAYRYQTAVP